MFDTFRARLRYLQEIRRIEAAIESAPAPPTPARLVDVRDGKAVWRIVLPGREDQYMKVEGRGTEDRYVVHVDADAFYLAMMRATSSLRTSSYGDTCMAREDMHQDYKFEKAVAGFASSQTSPVPLAKPAIGRDAQGRLAITFTDGITRTYWLLASGCSSFPVEMSSRSEARLLADQAGIGIESFANLFMRSSEPSA